MKYYISVAAKIFVLFIAISNKSKSFYSKRRSFDFFLKIDRKQYFATFVVYSHVWSWVTKKVNVFQFQDLNF